MDWHAFVNILAAIMIVGAVEEFGKASGQAAFEMLRLKGETFVNTVRKVFMDKQDTQSLDVLIKFESAPLSSQQEFAETLGRVSIDAAMTKQLAQIVQETRNNLFDILEEGFTENDLDKVALRLGFTPGVLYSSRATSSERALAIINKVEKQRRYPELLETIYKINPYLS